MDYLSLCLIAKDEDEYLQEWLDYHILIGVERFYIYDNESKNPIRGLLKEYIERGWVIVHEIKGTAVQVMAYQHCLQTYGENSKWIGFIDADEFIVLTKEKEIKQFLRKYESYGGLAISSVFFGPGGHIEHPIGGQIVNYRERFPLEYDDNRLIKCIVQPEKTVCPISPHDFIYKEPYYGVNSQYYRVDTQRFPVNFDEIRLNHYFTRSETKFKEKINRLGGDGREIGKEKLNRIRNIPLKQDLDIFTFIGKVLDIDQSKINDFSQNENFFLEFIHKLVNKDISCKKKWNLKENVINASENVPFHFAYNKQISTANKNQDWKKAKKLLLKSIDLLPMFAIRYTGYASTCLLLNEFDEARKTLEICLKKFGKTHEVLRVICDYWVALKQYSKAEECLKEMLIIGEGFDTLIRLAYVQFMLGQNLEAQNWVKLIVKSYWYSDYIENDFSQKVIGECIRIMNLNHNDEEANKIVQMLKPGFSGQDS